MELCREAISGRRKGRGGEGEEERKIVQGASRALITPSYQHRYVQREFMQWSKQDIPPHKTGFLTYGQLTHARVTEKPLVNQTLQQRATKKKAKNRTKQNNNPTPKMLLQERLKKQEHAIKGPLQETEKILSPVKANISELQAGNKLQFC